MECYRKTCTRKATETEFCPHCKSTYCSESCRVSDWIETHQFECADYLNFKLEDLKEVSDPRLQILGKGSYGEVKLYKHIQTATLYAVKIISKDFVKKHSSISILLREIKVHKNIRHSNIIQLIKYFEDTEKVYIILEYASKGSLFRIIRKEKGLDESRAWRYFTETCLGIKYLHDNEIIHRDLKPENILIDKQDHVKICDFGWCVQSSEIRTTFCGTLDYMAPEMLLNEGHSYPVDLWALGILLYELLHGYAPFRAIKEADKRQQILSNEITFAAGISGLAQDLILKLVKNDPKERIDINKALSHPWVSKFAPESELEAGMNINHPKFNEGEILGVDGVVCKVRFGETEEVVSVAEAEKWVVVKERITVGPIEKDAYGELEKWCMAPTRNKRKTRNLHLAAFEMKKDIEKLGVKRKGSIDCFEEVVERASYRAEIKEKEVNGVVSKKVFEVKKKSKQNLTEGDNVNDSLAKEGVYSNGIKPEQNVKISRNKNKDSNKGRESEKAIKNPIRFEKFGGVFDDGEHESILEERKKNFKKKEPFEGMIIQVSDKGEIYTKDSTSFQEVFSVKQKIDMSEGAIEAKREQLDSIRRTLESDNRARKIKKKDDAGFWEKMFGCLNRGD